MKDDIKRSDAVYLQEMFTVGATGWMVFLSFLFGGESYDYAFEVAGPNETERQARDGAVSLQCLHRARRNFLRDVELKVMH